MADQITVPRIKTDAPEFKAAENEVKSHIEKMMNVKGKRSVDSIHRELGMLMWDNVGMARNKKGLEEAIEKIQTIKKTFWTDVKIPGNVDEMNVELEKANRVADFIELGEMMAMDALNREESCGGHFREEFQTEDGEALRQDDKFAYVAAWECKGDGNKPDLHKEELKFEAIHLAQRNYKS